MYLNEKNFPFCKNGWSCFTYSVVRFPYARFQLIILEFVEQLEQVDVLDCDKLAAMVENNKKLS